MQELQVSIDAASEAEELKARGLDVVQTADGPVTVNVTIFNKLRPVSVDWAFVKDTLDHLHRRDPAKVTKGNLSTLIAEAAYARAALPFVKDKPWSDGVRLLARQMATFWRKPNRIWDSWYECSARVIHRGAVCA